MNLTEQDDRFRSVARLYGQPVLDQLATLRVTVIGLGGVGSWTAEALVRSGVGHLRLIDMDDICLTNINRQIHSTEASVGRQKCEAMAERIRGINPLCQVDAVSAFVTASNAGALLDGRDDWVVEATDRVGVKATVIAACRRADVAVVTVGGAGGRRDPTALRIADLGRAGGDTLLRLTRRSLRREHGWAGGNGHHYGVPCVFSPEESPPRRTTEDIPGARPGWRGLDCGSGPGAVCHVTASFGLAAASVVLNSVNDRTTPPPRSRPAGGNNS